MKKFTLLCFALTFAISVKMNAQCLPLATYATSPWGEVSAPATPYTGYLCQGHDSIFTRIGWYWYDGDGYLFKLIAGEDVTIQIDNCTANTAINIVDSTAAVGAGNFIAGAMTAAAACPVTLNFIAPYTGMYTMVFDNDANCATAGVDSAGTASIKLNNASLFTNCNPILGPSNDSICGALPLTLNTHVFGATNLATASDADDANLVTLGYTCFTPNNTVWYSFVPATSDSFSVYFGTDPNNSPLPGWFGVISTTSASNPCTTGLLYEGCYYGPLNATTAAGATAPPYDGIIPTGDSTYNHLYMVAGTTYYFVLDGVAGSIGAYEFGVDVITTGIKENNGLDKLVSLNPNPSKGLVQINNRSLEKNLVVEIYNTLGQNVMTQYLENIVSRTMDLTSLQKGIYTVKIKGVKSEMTHKLVLN